MFYHSENSEGLVFFGVIFGGYVIGEKDSNAKDAFIVLLFLFSQVL